VIQIPRYRVYWVVNVLNVSHLPVLRRARIAPVSPADALPPDQVALRALLERVAASQDRAAFAALFKHFAPRLKAYLLRGGLAPARAEELVQEIMLSVWRKAASFDPELAGVSTWVFAIARNARIDLARRARDLPPMPEEEEIFAPSAESHLLSREREALVRRALGELSAEQLQIVQLSFFSDTPHAAIASELNLPLGTVKSRIRLAMARLRKILGELQ